MNFSFTGILSIGTGNSTVISCLGDDPQTFPYPAEFRNREISEELIGLGAKFINSSIIVPANTTILMTLSLEFHRVEFTRLTEESAKLFLISLLFDEDSQFLLSQLQNSSRELNFGSEIDQILTTLPEGGAIENLVINLGDVDWTAALDEIIALLKTADPRQN